MFNVRNNQNIMDQIEKLHGGDSKQLEVIFSSEKRIIVEAPAGYGKTATMISRLAYLYSSGLIPNPKKALALTFSVNAALKIKREVAEKLPLLVNESNNPNYIGEKITVTNYHGICKSILNKYGYLFSPIFRKDIQLINVIGENEIEKISALKSISKSKLNYLIEIENKIRSCKELEEDEVHNYNNIIINEILPYEYMTHNSVILITIELFNKYPKIQQFYNDYYPLIIVDEFQDTNIIAWELLNKLISPKTELLFLGDSLQRIYGFIGAVPHIMSIAERDLQMHKITLDRNYRFKDNIEMLKLDKNIRANALELFHPNVESNAKLPTFYAYTQGDEANKVLNKITEIESEDPSSKIAVLFRSRGKNSNVFEDILNRNNVDYFYGMFKDDDFEYVNFHRYCLTLFIKRFGNLKTIGKKSLSSYVASVKKDYVGGDTRMTNSLFELLNAFVRKIELDYSDLLAEDKYNLISDTLENKQLKQAMEYVDTNLILCTVHGAKGLEWPYVFLTDIERYGMPSFFTCKNYVNKSKMPVKCACPLPSNEAMNIEEMIDELSVFYVAATRAKKQFYISASVKRGTGKDGCLSCFSHLKGIKIVNAEI